RRMLDLHADECRDVETEAAAVEDRAMAGNDARRLELLDALEHGRRAEPDLLAEADERRPAVLLQDLEDMEIYVVELDACTLIESHKVPGRVHRTFSWARRVLSTVS